jgi:hypothetical protein
MGTEEDYQVGYGKPPKNRQFGKSEGNPQRRGLWDIESTPRFKLEQMMKLSEAKLGSIIKDKTAPQFERKLATCINSGDWKTIKEMISEVYGQPLQVVESKTNMQVVLHDEARNEAAFNKQDE